MKTVITVKLSRPCIGAIVLRVLLVLLVLLTALVLPTAAAPLRMATEAALISATNAALSAAKNYTDAVAGQVRAEIPTNNAQLANGAGYVTAAITNGLQLTETDPTVPEWAKAPSAPLPPNYATVSNKAMSALQSFTETDPNVPEWAKAESAPLPPDYAAVSNAAKSAATPQQLAAKQDKLPYPTNAIPQGVISGLSTALAGKLDKTGGTMTGSVQFNAGWTAMGDESDTISVGQDAGDGYVRIGETKYRRTGILTHNANLYFPADSGTLALTNDIPDVSAIGTAATNYTDEVAGDLSTAIAGKYAKAAGDQLAQQVSAIGAHLNGEDARFVVTNYDSVVHTPEAYVEIKVSNNWLRVWDEGTRWNKFIGIDDMVPEGWEDYWAGFYAWHTNVDAELSYKADRAWGIYDSETGGYSPAGFTQVSSSNILIASGMAYQRTVTSAGAVWVLQCNQGVAQLGGDTNGYFKIMDSDGNSQFEVVKGDRREMGCDASGISLDHSTTPNNVIIPYSVVSEEHPTLYITERLETPNWKAETDADCIGTVTWTGSSGAYVATVHPKLAYPSMFIRATYMVGGETYIKNNAPVKMDSIILNGTKYYLGTATINGHTVLTLSTTAP